jgi:dihydroorotate dehydrogenase electron transfer subunit
MAKADTSNSYKHSSCTTQAPPLVDQPCVVLRHHAVGPDLFLLTLKPTISPYTTSGLPGEGAIPISPGQFVMLDLPTETFYFRRPFSVMAVTPDGHLVIYYKVLGDGTQQMANLQLGDCVTVLGPLGNGFLPADQLGPMLLVGGGIGIAPMAFMGQSQANGHNPRHCVYGVRQASDLGVADDLRSIFGDPYVHITTEDGSAGLKGRVTDWLQQNPDLVRQCNSVLVCGPTPMMKAVVACVEAINPTAKTYVSLEERMPCGTGACSGCVVPRSDQLLPSKTCTEGPVFLASTIKWDWA